MPVKQDGANVCTVSAYPWIQEGELCSIRVVRFVKEPVIRYVP